MGPKVFIELSIDSSMRSDAIVEEITPRKTIYGDSMLRINFKKSLISLGLASILLVTSIQTLSAADITYETAAEDPESASQAAESGETLPGSDITEEMADDVDVAYSDEYPEDNGDDAYRPDSISEESAEDTSVLSDEFSELTGEDESGTDSTVTDPTVEDSEQASYYDDGDGPASWVNPENIPMSPFSDVQDMSQNYYTYICWAGNNGISRGFGDGSFQSTKGCTRGEAMRFIWNMMGKPEPRYKPKSPFTDVPKDHAYYKAILWANQNGVAKGYSDGSFGVDKMCTRGHVMRFLWNLKGQPEPAFTVKSPFKDINSSHPYYKAILWGYQQEITKGFSDKTFGQNKSCTRGQIVTFLYKYYMLSFYTIKTKNGQIMTINSPIYEMDGAKYETVMNVNKVPVSVPTVPNKVLFLGNSLLQGLGTYASGGRFGMCASDREHDYAYRVQNAILAKNPEAEFTKLSGTAFEGCLDIATARKWYEGQRSKFAEDLDLIIIQLGDNVNTGEKTEAFKKNISPFLRQLKIDCPKARIICVATWYYRPEVVSAFISACKGNGCDFIAINDLYSPQTLPSAGCVITYNDGTTAVAAGGSLSHPNNRGMELIAKRIINMLNL